MEALVRKIEELSLNALPALETVLYDGWVLRFANGYTKRANSVNPLYSSTLPAEEKIANCEWWYRDQKAGVVYKMTRFVQPADLDLILAERGYAEESRTSVQTISLAALPSIQGTGTVEVYERLNAKWLSNFCTMNQVDSKNQAVLELMLKKIRMKTGFLLLSQGEKVVACGLGVVQGDCIGLFDVVTDPALRNRGFGTELVLRLLEWGKAAGADSAYLQVMTSNSAAMRLYARVGFKELYQYWYRIRHVHASPMHADEPVE